MKISINGILSIIAHEAVVLTTYDDGVGYLTIGVGHTAFAGNPRPKKGMKISLIEAINIFREDMKKYEKRVNDFVTVPLSQHRGHLRNSVKLPWFAFRSTGGDQFRILVFRHGCRWLHCSNEVRYPCNGL